MTVEEIAERLTEAQREWLLAAEPTLDTVAKEPCAEWWDNPESLYVEIGDETIWLATRYMRSPAGVSGFTEGWETLKPIALSLRQYLETRDG